MRQRVMLTPKSCLNFDAGGPGASGAGATNNHLRAPGASVPDGRTTRRNQIIAAGTKGAAVLIPVTNPIESTFATVRHRTIRAKGCLSNKTALAMVFKLPRRRAGAASTVTTSCQS